MFTMKRQMRCRVAEPESGPTPFSPIEEVRKPMDMTANHRLEHDTDAHEPHSTPSSMAVRGAPRGELREEARVVLAPFPRVLEPMLATSGQSPFSHPAWLFEPEVPGARALAFVREGQVRLVSRRGRTLNRRYPQLVSALRRQPQEMVLDGEILSQERAEEGGYNACTYYVFDLLYLDGFDLIDLPLEQRKALLESVLLPSDRLRLLDHLEEDGELAFEAAAAQGLPGVVAKLRNSRYEPGHRSASWLRIGNGARAQRKPKSAA